MSDSNDEIHNCGDPNCVVGKIDDLGNHEMRVLHDSEGELYVSANDIAVGIGKYLDITSRLVELAPVEHRQMQAAGNYGCNAMGAMIAQWLSKATCQVDMGAVVVPDGVPSDWS